MSANVLGRAAVTFVVLVASLGLVTWRQSRAFEAHVELNGLRQQVSVSQAERIELQRAIQRLESRTRVVPAAAERLQLYLPDASHQIILPSEPVQ